MIHPILSHPIHPLNAQSVSNVRDQYYLHLHGIWRFFSFFFSSLKLLFHSCGYLNNISHLKAFASHLFIWLLFCYLVMWICGCLVVWICGCLEDVEISDNKLQSSLIQSNSLSSFEGFCKPCLGFVVWLCGFVVVWLCESGDVWRMVKYLITSCRAPLSDWSGYHQVAPSADSHSSLDLIINNAHFDSHSTSISKYKFQNRFARS